MLKCPAWLAAFAEARCTRVCSNTLCYENENGECHPPAGAMLSDPDALQSASDQAPAAGCHNSVCAATRTPPQFSPKYRIDPTKAIEKEVVAEEFEQQWGELSNDNITIFSDSAEQCYRGTNLVGYGLRSTKNKI
ncbi:hypothetical protein H4I95_11512 [Botrytis cinerea]